jgi:broad specificity phosphatase PhoE
MTTIYLVRHGETDWNIEQRIQGHTDTPMNSKGKEQVKGRRKDLEQIHFDAIFSSDLSRAKDTADILVADHNLTVTTDKALRERTFGELEGCYSKEVISLFDLYGELSDAARLTHRIAPSAESDQELIDRLTGFLQKLALNYPNKTLLVITHGAIMRAFLAYCGYATFKQLWKGKIDNAAYVKLETDGTTFTVKETDGITVANS